jgi:hypothetical protein
MKTKKNKGREPTDLELKLKRIMDEVDELDLPDGAHWGVVHDRMGMEYGDVFPILEGNLEFFNCRENL